ncbi:hypothetical protein D915_004319 [Fasciola hepatica]|uniref:Uncharacterized protein n=1 Tax=Fasciola hepatica TaxID=6192 RepID=A0A4E0REA3_FASHE|nr:hypothetical protein D915_004319 [Fasciola hepatica]
MQKPSVLFSCRTVKSFSYQRLSPFQVITGIVEQATFIQGNDEDGDGDDDDDDNVDGDICSDNDDNNDLYVGNESEVSDKEGDEDYDVDDPHADDHGDGGSEKDDEVGD